MTFDPTRSGAQQLVDLGNTFAQALQHDKPVRASVRMTTEGHGFETEQRAAFDAWLRTVKMLATGAVTQPIAGSSAWSVASGSPHIDLCTDDPCLLEVHGDTRIGRHNVRRDACFARLGEFHEAGEVRGDAPHGAPVEPLVGCDLQRGLDQQHSGHVIQGMVERNRVRRVDPQAVPITSSDDALGRITGR